MNTREMLDELEQTERVVDVTDRATQVEHEEALHRRAAHDRLMVREQEPLPDGTFAVLDCDECGDEIDPRRLQVSIKNRHCIHCATKAELKMSGRR